MGRGIGGGLGAVACRGQNFSRMIDQDGANGNFATGGGLAGLIKSQVHEG